jgi:RNA polymerase sigma-70 factor (ECF subfamily)
LSYLVAEKEFMTSVDTAALVGAYLRGDSRAFDQLFSRYAGRLLNFINRIIRDRDRAEDLVQEAFIRIHRHLPRFDQSRPFSTWIYTIAANLARNELRNRSRSPLLRAPDLETPADERRLPGQLEDSRSRPDVLYRQRYLAEAVELSVATLSGPHREIFVLRELEGRSYEEIAGLTGVNLGTVKSRLNRARRTFARRIGPYLD